MSGGRLSSDSTSGRLNASSLGRRHLLQGTGMLIGGFSRRAGKARRPVAEPDPWDGCHETKKNLTMAALKAVSVAGSQSVRWVALALKMERPLYATKEQGQWRRMTSPFTPRPVRLKGSRRRALTHPAA